LNYNLPGSIHWRRKKLDTNAVS